MKTIVAVLLAAATIACSNIQHTPLVVRHPEAITISGFMPLPCGDGFMAAAHFPHDLATWQKAHLLRNGLRQLRREDEDVNGDRKVVVIVYMAPRVAVSITADFKQFVIEIRTDYLDNDKYHTEIWIGDIDDLLAKLSSSSSAPPPTYTTDGVISKEVIPLDPICPKFLSKEHGSNHETFAE